MGNPVKLNVVITIGVILVYPVVTVLVVKQLLVLLMVYQRIVLIVKTNLIPVREGGSEGREVCYTVLVAVDLQHYIKV